MPRFFIAGTNAAKGVALITGSDADHIKVLRMKIGDRLVVCDGNGTDHECRISRLGSGEVEAEILKTEPCPAEPSIDCTVLAGFAKGDRVDYLVQKCTEAGASSIVFFLCERCVARPDGKSAGKKMERLQRIAEQAAKQSGRGRVPSVSFVPEFADALEIAKKSDLRLFMYETGERVTIKEAIAQAGDFKSCAIITGPEGGFEPYEAEMASLSGMSPVAMGPRILRCETAPVIALTAVMYATDNL
jgi:16S rRNA (uracil1498-N3)-methyltransferase